MSRYLTFLFCFYIVACSAPKSPSLSFYYWKTHFSLTKIEQNALETLEVKKLYVKFFDIDWDAERQQAVPLASVSFDTLSLGKEAIVPTIFITNRTFLNTNPTQIEALVQKTSTRIAQLSPTSYQEIQLDCDWTAQTKASFFSFLILLKKINPTQKISCTIRLHQVKDVEQMGVPPCDQGVLMLYNTGELENNQETNSIFNAELAKNYLVHLSDYPLKLDFALAIFQWGVVQRDGKTIKLINALSEKELDNIRFLKKDVTHFDVAQSTYLEGHYLYAGDKIRLEQATPSDLTSITTFIAQNAPHQPYSLLFYHLDEKNILNYGVPFLTYLCSL
jgi:hypothetical protein